MTEVPHPGREPSTDIDYFVGAIPIVMILVIAGWTLFRHVDQPPAPSALMACFVNDNAPTILFDGQKVRVGGSNITSPTYSFHLQHYGTLAIDTKPGLQVTRAPSGEYRFATGDSPFIDPMMPVHLVSGKLYPVFKTEDAEFLQVEVIDGDPLIYKLAPASACLK